MWLPVPVNGIAMLAGIFCVLVALAVGCLYSAAILRAACWIYNMQVGGWYAPRSVPLPGWGKSVLICLAAAGVQFVVGFILQAMWLTGDASLFAASVMSLPAYFVAVVLVLHVLMPTTLLRAFVVALIQFVIQNLIAVILFLQAGGMALLRR